MPVTNDTGLLAADTNDDGIVTVPVGYGYDFAEAIAIDDGRVFLGGYASMGATGNDFALVCFDEYGDFDDTFSGDGIVTVPLTSGNDYCYDVAVDSEGRVVMAGRVPDGSSDCNSAVVRLDTDGTLDTSWGDGGIVVESYGSVQERVCAVTVDADDRIIFGGFATSDLSAADFTLWCYNATDGELDTSFGDGGVTQTDFSGSNVLQSLAIDSRGRIVVGGYVWGTTGDFMVARYLGNGQIDKSFGGGDGIVVESLTASQDYAYAVAIGPGDSIYAAGHATIDSEANFAVVHLNADGTLTTSTDQYVYSPRYIDAVICRDVADGATLVEGSRLYYTSDANHNVTALLSADGDVVERYLYTPYGQAEIYAGNWSETYETSTFDNTHLYTGRVHDGAIDLIYFRNRWYDAGVGRFVSRDPVGYGAEDANLYRYCGNSPLANSDSDGLKRSCTLITPTVIQGRTTSTYRASAAGPQVDVSLNPGTVINAEATHVKCTATVRANVRYACTDTYRVWDYWGCVFWYSTKTITSRPLITVSETIEWIEEIPEAERFNVVGSSFNIGPSGTPGLSVGWIKIPPASQALADGVCKSSIPPAWTPPATLS